MPPNGGPHVAKFPRGWGPERGDTRTELTAGALQAVTHLLLEAPAPPPFSRQGNTCRETYFLYQPLPQ